MWTRHVDGHLATLSVPRSLRANPGEASPGACVWLTGLSGVGKSTIAAGVVEQLRERGRPATVVDDPEVGRHLDADDPVGALTWLTRLLVESGVVVVVAVDTPARDRREQLRTQVPGFVEVFVDGRGRPDDTYEEPFAPELRVPTHDRESAASVAQIVSFLEDAGVMAHDPPHPSDA